MRGQAFVTFPSVELAQTALVCVLVRNPLDFPETVNSHHTDSALLGLLQNLVNGYVFKGKPMIIQFGRNAPAAKPNPSNAP